MPRQIVYEDDFDKAVDALGGYRAIDKAIDTVVEALYGNPYAFPKYESDFISFRYVILRPIDDLPSLIVVFRIGANGDVYLEHIEENVTY